MATKCIVLIFVLVVNAYGLPHGFGDRILNGEAADIQSYPYQVSVKYTDRHLCGGTILNANVVLTAAHCTYGMNHNQFKVHAGVTNQYDNNGQVIKVKKVIQHENYNNESSNQDLSILILSEPLVFNDFVAPIALAKTAPAINSIATVTGYGFIADGGPLSDQLQKLNVPVLDHEKCNQFYHGVLTKYMMCAGYVEGGKDACQGDSGGPLVYNNELVGVVSWGVGCGLPNRPGIYASVPSMLTWIKLNMK